MRALTQEQFIVRAKAVHGNKYDYSKAIYATGESSVMVFCRIHNEYFFHQAERHLNGTTGCVACAREVRIRKRTKTTEQFIKDARLVHGDRFDYSQSRYIGAQKKLTIICSLHGPFSQLATNHLSGYGCAECATRKLFHEKHISEHERNDPAEIYVLEIGFGSERYCKLGYTSNFYQRAAHLKNQGVTIFRETHFETTKFIGYGAERALHAKYRGKRAAIAGRFGGCRECYPLELMNEIIEQVNFKIGKDYKVRAS